eukprot:gene4684-5299_t
MPQSDRVSQEPWSCLKVSFELPRAAAKNLRNLARHGDKRLKDIGVLKVQIKELKEITLSTENVGQKSSWKSRQRENYNRDDTRFDVQRGIENITRTQQYAHQNIDESLDYVTDRSLQGSDQNSCTRWLNPYHPQHTQQQNYNSRKTGSQQPTVHGAKKGFQTKIIGISRGVETDGNDPVDMYLFEPVPDWVLANSVCISFKRKGKVDVACQTGFGRPVVPNRSLSSSSEPIVSSKEDDSKFNKASDKQSKFSQKCSSESIRILESLANSLVMADEQTASIVNQDQANTAAHQPVFEQACVSMSNNSCRMTEDQQQQQYDWNGYYHHQPLLHPTKDYQKGFADQDPKHFANNSSKQSYAYLNKSPPAYQYHQQVTSQAVTTVANQLNANSDNAAMMRQQYNSEVTRPVLSRQDINNNLAHSRRNNTAQNPTATTEQVNYNTSFRHPSMQYQAGHTQAMAAIPQRQLHQQIQQQQKRSSPVQTSSCSSPRPGLSFTEKLRQLVQKRHSFEAITDDDVARSFGSDNTKNQAVTSVSSEVKCYGASTFHGPGEHVDQDERNRGMEQRRVVDSHSIEKKKSEEFILSRAGMFSKGSETSFYNSQASLRQDPGQHAYDRSVYEPKDFVESTVNPGNLREGLSVSPTVVTPKRKRGRPPKSAHAHLEPSPATHTKHPRASDPNQPKRKRGRPPKIKTEFYHTEPNADESHDIVNRLFEAKSPANSINDDQAIKDYMMIVDRAASSKQAHTHEEASNASDIIRTRYSTDSCSASRSTSRSASPIDRLLERNALDKKHRARTPRRCLKDTVYLDVKESYDRMFTSVGCETGDIVPEDVYYGENYPVIFADEENVGMKFVDMGLAFKLAMRDVAAKKAKSADLVVPSVFGTEVGTSRDSAHKVTAAQPSSKLFSKYGIYDRRKRHQRNREIDREYSNRPMKSQSVGSEFDDKHACDDAASLDAKSQHKMSLRPRKTINLGEEYASSDSFDEDVESLCDESDEGSDFEPLINKVRKPIAERGMSCTAKRHHGMRSSLIKSSNFTDSFQPKCYATDMPEFLGVKSVMDVEGGTNEETDNKVDVALQVFDNKANGNTCKASEASKQYDNDANLSIFGKDDSCLNSKHNGSDASDTHPINANATDCKTENRAIAAITSSEDVDDTGTHTCQASQISQAESVHVCVDARPVLVSQDLKNNDLSSEIDDDVTKDDCKNADEAMRIEFTAPEFHTEDNVCLKEIALEFPVSANKSIENETSCNKEMLPDIVPPSDQENATDEKSDADFIEVTEDDAKMVGEEMQPRQITTETVTKDIKPVAIIEKTQEEIHEKEVSSDVEEQAIEIRVLDKGCKDVFSDVHTKDVESEPIAERSCSLVVAHGSITLQGKEAGGSKVSTLIAGSIKTMDDNIFSRIEAEIKPEDIETVRECNSELNTDEPADESCELDEILTEPGSVTLDCAEENLEKDDVSNHFSEVLVDNDKVAAQEHDQVIHAEAASCVSPTEEGLKTTILDERGSLLDNDPYETPVSLHDKEPRAGDEAPSCIPSNDVDKDECYTARDLCRFKSKLDGSEEVLTNKTEMLQSDLCASAYPSITCEPVICASKPGQDASYPQNIMQKSSCENGAACTVADGKGIEKIQTSFMFDKTRNITEIDAAKCLLGLFDSEVESQQNESETSALPSSSCVPSDNALMSGMAMTDAQVAEEERIEEDKNDLVSLDAGVTCKEDHAAIVKEDNDRIIDKEEGDEEGNRKIEGYSRESLREEEIGFKEEGLDANEDVQLDRLIQDENKEVKEDEQRKVKEDEHRKVKEDEHREVKEDEVRSTEKEIRNVALVEEEQSNFEDDSRKIDEENGNNDESLEKGQMDFKEEDEKVYDKEGCVDGRIKEDLMEREEEDKEIEQKEEEQCIKSDEEELKLKEDKTKNDNEDDAGGICKDVACIDDECEEVCYLSRKPEVVKQVSEEDAMEEKMEEAKEENMEEAKEENGVDSVSKDDVMEDRKDEDVKDEGMQDQEDEGMQAQEDEGMQGQEDGDEEGIDVHIDNVQETSTKNEDDLEDKKEGFRNQTPVEEDCKSSEELSREDAICPSSKSSDSSLSPQSTANQNETTRHRKIDTRKRRSVDTEEEKSLVLTRSMRKQTSATQPKRLRSSR